MKSEKCTGLCAHTDPPQDFCLTASLPNGGLCTKRLKESALVKGNIVYQNASKCSRHLFGPKPYLKRPVFKAPART